MKKERISNFMKETGVSIVIGYDKYIDWLVSSALDLLLLDYLQLYKNMGAFCSFFRKTYQEIIPIAGLKVYACPVDT